MTGTDARVNEVQLRELEGAFDLLSRHVDFRHVDQDAPLRANAVYTNGLAIWLMVLQRMTPRGTLESTVKQLVERGSSLLPPNKRVEEGSLSLHTGGFSRARKRIPVDRVRVLFDQVTESILAAGASRSRRWFLIDGTTLSLQPTPELRAQYPPARNQFGPGVWPIANMVVVHDLETGCALRPETGSMYGAEAVGEVELACRCLSRIPPNSCLLADIAYGIHYFAYQCRQHGHSFLLRLSDHRWRAIVRNAEPDCSGDGWATYRLTWHPSARERQSHADLPPDAAVEVRLHEFRVHENLVLHLVTDLPDTAEECGQRYLDRQLVETDIRNLKVVLETEQIRVKSAEMFEKDLLTSFVAYNLVSQFRRLAAAEARVAPRRLSFKRVWTTFTIFLLDKPATTDFAEWCRRFARALCVAQQDKLPDRPGRRYPRSAYPRRPKTTHVKKRKPPASTEDSTDTT